MREQGFTRFSRETQALFKVVGITDLAAWQADGLIFEEIAPKSVKKIITGNGNASKADVATALGAYIGEQAYACDDESDAVAVGVAWLILNGYIMEENNVRQDD